MLRYLPDAVPKIFTYIPVFGSEGMPKSYSSCKDGCFSRVFCLLWFLFSGEGDTVPLILCRVGISTSLLESFIIIGLILSWGHERATCPKPPQFLHKKLFPLYVNCWRWDPIRIHGWTRSSRGNTTQSRAYRPVSVALVHALILRSFPIKLLIFHRIMPS